MNEKFDFDVIFYVRRWEGFVHRSLVEAIADAIYPWGKVLVVKRPLSPAASLLKNRGDIDGLVLGKRLRKDTKNIYVFTPFEVGHNIIALRFPFLAFLNRVVLSRQLKNITCLCT